MLCYILTSTRHSILFVLSKHPLPRLWARTPPQPCPREAKPKPECREPSQLLTLSTHPQRYPLKINHAGKPPRPPVSNSRLMCVHTCPPTLHWELFRERRLCRCSRKQMWEWRQPGSMLHEAMWSPLLSQRGCGGGERWRVFCSCPDSVQMTRRKAESICSVPYRQHMASFCQTSETWVGTQIAGLRQI